MTSPTFTTDTTDAPAPLEGEARLTLNEAARLREVHPATLTRWLLKGVAGVRLEAVRHGGRWYTSREALARFSHACTAAARGEPIGPRSPAQRRRAVEAADRELAAAGV